MNQTLTWTCLVFFALLTATTATAQRSDKPLDRGVHKRTLLKGYSVLRGQHPPNNKNAKDLKGADARALRLPGQGRGALQTLMPRACQPVAASIHARHLRRPSILPAFQRPQPKMLRVLSMRRPALSPWRSGLRRDSVQTNGQGIAPTLEEHAASAPPQGWIGPGMTVAGLLVGLRAMLRGQRIGDWLDDGGAAQEGMILGGVITFLGAIFIGIRNVFPIAKKVRNTAPAAQGMSMCERVIRNRNIQKDTRAELLSKVPAWKLCMYVFGLTVGLIWMSELFGFMLFLLILAVI